MPRTKIVATLGPASEDPSVLGRMIAAGASVVRLNASHGTCSDLERRLRLVREAAADSGRHVAVMLDLGGPKLRIGEVVPGVVLERGARLELVAERCVGDRQRVCLTHPEVIADIPPGARVLIDDGRVELMVDSREGSRLLAVVITGGPLSSHKGVNVPGVRLSIDAMTDKDREDLVWGLGAGVDFVAQSFVRGPEDVEALRALMGDRVVPIVAKIEKHEATERLESIVEAADAVMVARGDLGVETATEQVPLIQRRVVALAREHGKPAIVATQMLESMVASPRPTRAEASDVANAIFEQADAVMLSAETAVGAYPVEAVETMARIAEVAEREVEACGTEAPPRAGRSDVARAVSAAACEIARVLDLAAIVTATQSGATARAVAAHRPSTPIVAATPDERVARRVALVWGVEPLVVPQHGSIDEMLAHAVDAVRKAGFAREGKLVALTAGVAVGVPGTTNLVQVTRV